MSVLQVANIHLETTANNRIHVPAANTVAIVAAGANTFLANSSVTSLLVAGVAALTANSSAVSIPGLGAFLNVNTQIFSTNGTFTVPTNAKHIIGIMTGAGGRGANGTYVAGSMCTPTTGSAGAGGGGGGGIIFSTIASSIGADASTQAVTVGIGGGATRTTSLGAIVSCAGGANAATITGGAGGAVTTTLTAGTFLSLSGGAGMPGFSIEGTVGPPGGPGGLIGGAGGAGGGNSGSDNPGANGQPGFAVFLTLLD